MIRRLDRPARVACVLVLFVAGCGAPALTKAPGPPSTSPSEARPSSSPDRTAGWRGDLESLVGRMDRIHPALFHGTSRADLDAAVTALEARIGAASDDELMVGVLRIVAMVSAAGCDAHTGAFVWGTGRYPVESLPLRLWWFEDGLYVVDALPPYRDLVGSRVDGIAGHPTADVLRAIGPLVPRDNDATVRLLIPRYVLMPQVLRGLDLAGPGPIDLTVTPGAGADGAPREVRVDPIPMTAYNGWAGAYGLHLPTDPGVPYLARIADVLWWQRLPDRETLFVQYNRVDSVPSAQVAALQAALHEPGIVRVVLDIRHNYGGEVRELDPILALFQDPAVDRAGHLFVITGRNTFSAASLLAARLDATTSAIVTGEPMGGCPTAYGDSSDTELPYSHIVVSVSDLLEVGTSADDRRSTIEPELPAPLTPAAWAAKRDPALDAILAERP